MTLRTGVQGTVRQLAAVAVAVVSLSMMTAGVADAAAAASSSETPGTCTSGSLTVYGKKTTCLKGSSYDRVRVGTTIDSTFAIRADRQVIYISSSSGWQNVSNGKADYITYVDADYSGLHLVCVKTKAGHAYSATHDRNGWTSFSVGCPLD